MSNSIRSGSDSMLVQHRHGRRGHIALATSVPPELKDHLIEFCQSEGVTMKEAIERALREFLYEVRA